MLPAAIVASAARGDEAAVSAWLDDDEHHDVDAREAEHGGTLLLAASNYGHAELVDLLLRRGATVDLAGRGGGTALMGAAHEYGPGLEPAPPRPAARAPL